MPSHGTLLTHKSQLTNHNSQITTHNSQLTTHNSQLTTHKTRLCHTNCRFKGFENLLHNTKRWGKVLEK